MKIDKFIKKTINSVNPDTTLKQIEEIMEKNKVRHLLVIEHGELFGIISDRDVKKYRSLFAETKISQERDNATLEFKAHKIMTREVITIKKGILAKDAITLMLNNNISCLPVLSEDESLIGVISSKEIMRWVVRLLDFLR